MNGHEFLEAVRENGSIKDSVIFILSTSNDDLDKKKAYDKNIAGYITKECAGDDFQKVLSLLENYQLIVQLPTS